MLESGEYLNPQEFAAEMGEAHLSIDAEAGTGVLTFFEERTFAFTLSELPEAEWAMVRTGPLTRSPARTYAMRPGPIVTRSATLENPRLAAVADPAGVLLVAGEDSPEAPGWRIWFDRQ